MVMEKAPKVKRFSGCGAHGYTDDGLERYDAWCPACQKWPDPKPTLTPAQREARRLDREGPR